MKTISMSELQKGDIFCHELKLNGREAFEVTELHEKTIHCQSRNTGDIIRKQRYGNVILLKRKEPCKTIPAV